MKKSLLLRFLQGCLAVTLGVSLAGYAFADQHESSPSVDPALQAVIDGEHRSAEHKARDQYRHPAKTLTWLGLKSHMTVVEITPGRGWNRVMVVSSAY